MIKARYFLIPCLIMAMVSCHRDSLQVDVSDIRVQIPVLRFEKDLFMADPAALESHIPLWQKQYGVFFNHFNFITRLGHCEDAGYAERLRTFATDKSNYTLFKRTREVFSDLNTLEKGLNDGFRHYQHYFPNRPIPRVITYISGLNQSAITDDSLLAIGLDKYLGQEEPLYKQAGMYQYLVKNMYPGKIVSDAMQFWGDTEFAYNDSVNNLITKMIHMGRLLYFTRAMLPDHADTCILGFSAREIKYLETNEKPIWTYMVEQKLLFVTDRFTMDKFLLEGPFTKDFGRDSPARAAVWIGYRIVSAYLQRNREITLPRLMQETDYLKILNRSGYNPR